MCVIMSENRVGVRELRQNLSVYLRKVKRGQHFEVTERGVPVALLAPLPEVRSALDLLVAAGRATAATRTFADLEPLSGEASTALSDSLMADRDASR